MIRFLTRSATERSPRTCAKAPRNSIRSSSRPQAPSARLTDCLSIVLAPTVLETRVKQITLVSLTAFRAICVVVTEDGNVFNRQMDFTIPVGSDELSRIQVLLSKALCGKSLSDVERGLSFGMKRAFSDPLVRAVLDEVLSCIQEGQTGRTHQLGMSALLAQPEFSHTDAVLPLVQVLEDDTVLLHILDDLTSTDEDLSVQHREGKQDRGPLGGLRCGEPLRTRRGGRRRRRHRADANGLFEGYPSRARGKRGAWRIVVNCAALASR